MAKRSKKSQPKTSTPKVALQSLAGRTRIQVIADLALILLTTFLVYSPAFNGARLWDDDANVTQPDLQSPAGLCRIWFEFGATQQYYPLLHTAFWIEHQLWGDRPTGYHIISLIWHLISIVLVYAIVKRLEIPGALLAAALFALHPVMVESVAWITEQKNTLSTVFYLSSLLVYLHFDASRKVRQYWGALALFVMAILTKSAVVTLPAALLVIFWWQRGAISWRRDVLPLIPFFVAAALMGVATCHVEWTFVGASDSDFALSLTQRFLLAGRAIWFYLSKLFWPANLIFIYPRWEADPHQWWQWIFPIVALAVTAALWAMRQRSRAPLAAWLFFCGTLLPMLPFLNQYVFLYTFVSDHFLYVASLGIVVLVSGIIGALLDRLRQAQRLLAGSLCVVIVAFLAVKSWSQSKVYANTASLFRDTIDRNPSCWMAYNNLGLELITAGKPQIAIEQFRRAIEIRPNLHQPQTNLGTALANSGQMQEALEHLQKAVELRPTAIDVHRNLGNALLKTNRLPEAVEEFRAALALRADDPPTLNSLGSALTQMGRFPEAVENLQHALRLRPDYSEAHGNLGNALAKSGRLSEAIDELRAAVVLKSDDSGAINNLGIAYLAAGRLPESIEQLQRAVRLNPSAEAHSNLGNALTKAGRLPEAIAELQSAVALKPDYVSALNNLGIALVRAGRFPEGIEHLQHAVRLQPDFADAHNNLGAALTHTGKIPEAIEQFRQTERLNPSDFNAHNNLGILLAQTGAIDESLAQLEQAMRLRPDSADVHNSIGELMRQSGKLPQAIEHFQTALRLAPNSVQTYASLAQALSASNRPDEAIATAKQGIAVANSAGQQAAAKQLEQWLSHVQTGSRSNRDIASPPRPAPPSETN